MSSVSERVLLKLPTFRDMTLAIASSSPKNYRRVILDHSPSFKSWGIEKRTNGAITFKFPNANANGNETDSVVPSPKALTNPAQSISPRPLSEKDAAAVKVQKVYKSYRTRRNLADCAVVVEELWWSTLESVELKLSSIEFFDNEKPETAMSRWARAGTRVAKVGKGLSKDEKAQKLALKHWLEAIDPRHRYGHNLRLYYDVWFDSQSTEPFFYWLDVGEGKEVSLHNCPRSILQHQRILYLGPKMRKEYEVIVKDGLLAYKQNRSLINTDEESKWIFVLSSSRNLYVGKKEKGRFQHSSFLSGGATVAAGRLIASEGVLKAIWPYSGHYLPREEHFKEFISFLEDNNVDLTNVKRYSIDDDDRYTSFENKDDLAIVASTSKGEIEETTFSESVNDDKLKDIVNQVEEPLLAMSKPLSCKWTSGTGPRISCVRDYPVDLQSKALEQVNLSPQITPSPVGSRGLIRSPRPSPEVRLSPRLACIGIPSPRMSLPTLLHD